MSTLSSLLIIATPFLIIFTENWMFMWMMLEINTIAFVFFLFNLTTKKEETMKYFLIQVSSSMMILMMFIYSTKMNIQNSITSINLSSQIIFISMMVKMGVCPFHLWLMSIFSFLNWIPILVLLTWQKIIPIWISSFMNKINIWLLMTISIIMSTIYQFKTNNMKILMLFSSIANLSWIIFIVFFSKKMFLLIFSVYSLIMMSIILTFKKSNLNFLNTFKEKKTFLSTLILLFSLSGIPPLIGFLSKWISFIFMIKMFFMMMILIFFMMAVMNTFIYMRILYPNLTKSLKMKKQNKKNFLSLILFQLSLLFLFPML